MFMCKQMVLAVFVIAVAFGTESEFQRGILLICSSADGTFMLCNTGVLFDFTAELLASSGLLGGHADTDSGG